MSGLFTLTVGRAPPFCGAGERFSTRMIRAACFCTFFEAADLVSRIDDSGHRTPHAIIALHRCERAENALS